MDSYREFATALSKKAGSIIKNGFSPNILTEWKDDNTPVTKIDKEINSLVIKSIQEKYPEHSIVAEEESKLSNSDYVWVCDPLDGTIPFTSGYPTSVFTISLVHKGDPILGTIYDPYMDRFLIAEKGKGAYSNDKKITVSNGKSLKNNIISVESVPDIVFDLTPILLKGGMTISIRSIVYTGMLLAMGQVAGIIYGGKSPWDAAAVKIIVEEAGGKVTDLHGQDQRYDQNTFGFIASNGLLHEELLEIVAPIIKK